MEEQPKGHPLSSFGECALIDHLTKDFPPLHPETKLGVGDDAAVIQPPTGEQLVVTTDILLEGIHFNLTYTSLVHLGYKSVAVNLSDVYAMNARPVAITVTIGVSQRFTVEQLEDLYKGIRIACNEFGVDLVGGDTSASLTGLTISITAMGFAKPDALCYRSGAKVNELVCVTGNLGAAYCGLRILELESRVFAKQPTVQPKLEGYEFVIGRLLRPRPRQDAYQQFAAAGIKPSAMMDISDGLSSELLHICKSSHVGCRIYPERLPIDQQTYRVAEELHLDPLFVAMNGGEDYELLFTVPAEYNQKMDDMGVSVIGYTTAYEQGTVLVTSEGKEYTIDAHGWQAFKEEKFTENPKEE